MQIEPPRRASFEYVQALNAAPDAVFPLLCPVREAEWVPGWNPRLVLSASGVAEPGCVFTTPDGETGAGAPREATWVVTAHDPDGRHVAMVKVSPEYLVTRLWIDVQPGEEPSTSRARVTYEYTALGPDGVDFVRTRTPLAWQDFMQTWERALNEYLDRRGAQG